MSKLYNYSFEVRYATPIKRELVFSAAPVTEYPLPPTIKGFNILYGAYKNAQALAPLNKDLIDGVSFTHVLANYSQIPTGVYRVEAELEDGTKEQSELFDLFSFKVSKRETEYADAFLRRSMFEFFTGPGNIPVLFYPRRVSGEKCACSPVGQGSAAFNCMNCLGVGFIGGYHGPILGFIDYASMDGKTKDNGKIIIAENSSNAIRTSAGFVLLRAYDIIRELRPPFQAWEVINVQVSRFNARPVHLQMPVKMLDSGHPIYKLPLLQPEYYPDVIPYRQIDKETGLIVSFEDEYDKMASSLKAIT
jgi:hypothetical protein